MTQIPTGTDPAAAAPIGDLATQAADPAFEGRVREVIERGLASDPDAFKAVRNLMEMLTRALGSWETASSFLALLAFVPSETDDAVTYDLIEDPEVRSHLRALVARLGGLYGREVRIGYDLSTRDPHDWQYIEVRSLFDPDEAEWTVDFTLRHFNQGESHVSGPPISVLRLVNRLLAQLRALEAMVGEDFRTMFDDEAISEFTDLAAVLAAGLEQQPPQGPDAPGAGPEAPPWASAGD